MTHPQQPTETESGPTGQAPEPGHGRPTRPIGLLLAGAVLTTAVVVALALLGRAPGSAGTEIGEGRPVPSLAGGTLDGGSFDLASSRGRPVVINFWKPTCVPCRTEFPLLAAKATEHKPAGLLVVGVMSDDPVDLAREFAAQYGSSWSSVIDEGGRIKAAYRVVAWPQTYFVDAAGVLRSIQIGEITAADFERKYALIAGPG